MDCYNKYFFQCSLWLDDGFCSYYVQDTAWGRQDILDVESVIFDWEEDAKDWLHQCAGHNPEDTYQQLPRTKAEWRSNYAVKDSWNDNGYYVEHTVGPDGLKVWEGRLLAKKSQGLSANKIC